MDQYHDGLLYKSLPKFAYLIVMATRRGVGLQAELMRFAELTDIPRARPEAL